MSLTPDVIQQSVDLAKSQPQNQPAVESTEIPAPVCAVDDKDCVNRWVQAFSDCD